MQFSKSTLLAFATFASLGAAAPTEEVPVEISERSACTFTTAAAAIAGKTSCSTIYLNGIEVPAGTTLDLTGLNSGTTVVFEGTTTFKYKEWVGPLISFSGSKITVKQATGAKIDGQGSLWWDGSGSNGGKTKPKFIYAHDLTDSVIEGLQIYNSPVQTFSIQSDNLNITNVLIDSSAGDSLGHNTDAFDIGNSNYVTISGATVYNQDDCLAVNSGTNIEFTGGYCSGGHGLSIGSVGGRSNNVVKTVTISDSQVVNSQNGCRIKTVSGATGSVSGVTYSGITLSNISKYGIVVQQDYKNGSPTGTPTNGVSVTDIAFKNISGSVASGAVRTYILCGKGSCSNWTWSGVTFTGGAASSKCTNVPSPATCS